VFTDESGYHRVPQVPGGPLVLEITFIGLDDQLIPLTLTVGQTLVQNVDLTSAARYGEGVLRLDAYTVTSSRETDARSIAVNEQRYAPNLKNVVTTDSVGDVVDGNVGEFLKYLPGVMGDFDTDEAASTIATVSIRGFSSNLTGVSADGAQLANTSNATGTSRSFSFGQVSINNYALTTANSSVDESDVGQTGDPNAVRGRITVRNTGLRPWTADNYDLSLEHYTKDGGLISIGAFLKRIKNFFGTFSQVATAEDLDRLGLDGYEYQGRRLIMDASLDYQLHRRLTLFFNAQNVFKEPLYAYRYSSTSPDYAKRPYLVTVNGVQFTAGLKGSF